jgi:hypothetical protein
MSKRSTRLSYPSDLSDNEWEVIKPYIPPQSNRGLKRVHSYREILNAISICYVLVVPGECSRTNFHLGKLFIIISAFGDLTDLGSI